MTEEEIRAYLHRSKRLNNPQVGLVTPQTDAREQRATYAYDPHLAPVLQFDSARAASERLIDEALASEDPQAWRAALEELKRAGAPFLEWAGKAERTSFAVPTVSLHVHERLDPTTLLEAARRPEAARPIQGDLFDAPFVEKPLREEIDFYKHARGWANRLIAGDSLVVMNSLLAKERMAGAVQMIYIDPPYGIKYGSNFQPFVNKRDVKDGADDDLTREPEQIRAFRDTWELGIHSYLTYLRDRLWLAKELLAETGSVFVQIGDENLHHVRELMDEILGPDGFVSVITFKKTAGQTAAYLAGTTDYIVWYAKRITSLKYRTVFKERALGEEGSDAYTFTTLPNSGMRRLTQAEVSGASAISQGMRPFRYQLATSQREGRPSGEGSAMHFRLHLNGEDFYPTANRGWTATAIGMERLVKAGRIAKQGANATYIRYLDDFPAIPITNFWGDTQSGSGMDKIYVVQTSQKIIERCLLMTTDPGDLVLDPTCGSGTTAFVAEKWGRRWITCDTSRVATTLARQRLMTASFDYYPLKYPLEGLKAGFIYKSVPHVTLKSIANNPDIDAIWERMHPAVEAALKALNKAARLELNEWEVPFDLPEDWPAKAGEPFAAFHAARRAMQTRMDESIARNAGQETLYDQPEIDRKKVRVSGPFTVEAVPFPTVLGLEAADSVPAQEATAAVARSGESGRQHQWRDELLAAGIRGKGGQRLGFAELEPSPGRWLHAVGTLKDNGERVAVSFGPEFAALEQRQVSLAIDEAMNLKPSPKWLVFAAFTFDPEAAKDIDETNWAGVTLLKAQMNADLLTEDLKKKGRGNDAFWLMGQPEIEQTKLTDGTWQVRVLGFDYFDLARGEIRSGGAHNIAVWLLDTDYDGRSLYPSQVFFPLAGEKDGWHRLARSLRATLDPERLRAWHGTESLPFTPGKYRRIAVKIVDDRGIESLVVRGLD